jgi:hypothetical protein
MILPKVASSYRSGDDDASTLVSGGMTLNLERQAVDLSETHIELGDRKPDPKFPEWEQVEMQWNGGERGE